MKTVQMTMEEGLLAQVDRTVRRLGTTRSAFTRRALMAALGEEQRRKRERRHAAGYRAKPVRRGEFSAWESEQVWPD